MGLSYGSLEPPFDSEDPVCGNFNAPTGIQSYSPRHFYFFSIYLFCLLAKVLHLLFTTNQGKGWANP